MAIYQPTHTDYALLSAYANSPMLGEGLTILDGTGGQAVKNFVSPLGGWKENIITLQHIQNVVNVQPQLGGYEQTNLVAANLSGMAAQVFTKDGQTVIAFRGTQADEGGDLFWEDAITDMGLGLGLVGTQVRAAYWFYQAVLNVTGVNPENISFTGHSLGGALASIMAYYTGKKAVVFDPAPNRNTALKLAAGVEQILKAGDEEIPFFPDPPAKIDFERLWPAIPPASSSSDAGITRITLDADPITLAFSDNGGGMLGQHAQYHLNYDQDVFADNTIEMKTKLSDLHSIHLIA